jgi:hypothetical protein
LVSKFKFKPKLHVRFGTEMSDVINDLPGSTGALAPTYSSDFDKWSGTSSKWPVLLITSTSLHLKKIETTFVWPKGFISEKTDDIIH